MTLYVATINVPGYLPTDDDPPVFGTAQEAWQYLIGEVELFWDDYPDDESGGCVDAHTQMHNIDQTRPGTVYAATPGPARMHDLGLAYSVSVAEGGE